MNGRWYAQPPLPPRPKKAPLWPFVLALGVGAYLYFDPGEEASPDNGEPKADEHLPVLPPAP